VEVILGGGVRQDVLVAQPLREEGRVHGRTTTANHGSSCTNLIFLAGTGNESMLPEHVASYDELAGDCVERFVGRGIG
jgi:hypothetical protein